MLAGGRMLSAEQGSRGLNGDHSLFLVFLVVPLAGDS